MLRRLCATDPTHANAFQEYPPWVVRDQRTGVDRSVRGVRREGFLPCDETCEIACQLFASTLDCLLDNRMQAKGAKLRPCDHWRPRTLHRRGCRAQPSEAKRR